MTNELQAYYENKKILITAGATYENIDPVRFIGNRSSGKMGIAIANAFYEIGSQVYLIKANTDNNIIINKGINIIKAEDSERMQNECLQIFPKMDFAIMAAAVADFKPEKYNEHKIKKGANTIKISFQKTPDIIASLGKQKQLHQYLVGFALETENGHDNAKQKMQNKNCDMMILNLLKQDNKIFGSDKNSIYIFTKKLPVIFLENLHKTILAKRIIACIHQDKIGL